jgi:formylglycine-generating enzyme
MSDSEHACCAPAGAGDATHARPEAAHRPRSTKGQIAVAGVVFTMGDQHGEGYPADGEEPVHEVALSPFHIDATAVTNAQFSAFVRDTGWVTDAEELGVSAVFHLAFRGRRHDVVRAVAGTPWWLAVRGADWRHPNGPRSDINQNPQHPVVHVSWHDAQAYCAWAGKSLPTEAQWEYAARGGLEGARFPWGDELAPRGRWRCNIWQGRFPDQNTGEDGYVTTAPVRTFMPNGLGLYQTSGNVWEWCQDWFSADYYAGSPRNDPPGPSAGTARVTRGGSFLCHESYCHRYRVAARSAVTPESTAANVGFRCANPG